jgi:hypothetical protein
MGNGTINSSLGLYGKSVHPIEGEVLVYLLKNDAGKFIMRTNK